MVRYGWQVRKCKSLVFPTKRLFLVTGCCIVLGQKKERREEGGKEGGERESEDGRKRGRRKIRKERGRREERRKRKMSEKEPLRVMSWWKRGFRRAARKHFLLGDRRYHFKVRAVYNSGRKHDSPSYLKIREREIYEIGNFRDNQGNFVSLLSSGTAQKTESYCAY